MQEIDRSIPQNQEWPVTNEQFQQIRDTIVEYSNIASDKEKRFLRMLLVPYRDFAGDLSLWRNRPNEMWDLMRQGYRKSLPAFVDMCLGVSGVIDRLDEVGGILPSENNPNPYHCEDEEELHNKWWEEHPVEGDDFCERIEKRDDVIKYAYYALVVEYLVDDRLNVFTKIDEDYEEVDESNSDWEKSSKD